MSNNTNKLIVFLDAIGRTIIGKVVNETEEILSVQNPALVAVQTDASTNRIQLQIFPLFFKEFQADRNEPTVWNYKKANLTLAGDIVFVVQVIAQYEQLFAPVAAAPVAEPQVVKLFEE